MGDDNNSNETIYILQEMVAALEQQNALLISLLTKSQQSEYEERLAQIPQSEGIPQKARVNSSSFVNETPYDGGDLVESKDVFPINTEVFICPITLDYMKDPVCSIYGHLFEREAIAEWLRVHRTCPLTGKPLNQLQIYPCHSMKTIINDFLNAGLESPLCNPLSRSVVNHGQIVVPTNIRSEGVQELNGVKMRSLDKFYGYPLHSSYIIFPGGMNFLFTKTTGYIGIENTAVDKSVRLLAYSRRDGDQAPARCGEFILKPLAKQTFDFYGGSYTIEIADGDCSTIAIYEFSRSGGGKGDGLGMATTAATRVQ